MTIETESATTTASQQKERRWRPLDRIQRRVAGVLVEKAKTTPDNYPLSLNALVNGSNQKSNRFPQMELDEERVSDALDQLREMGAVAQIQGDGRVDKYRHLLYEWLGVDKTELAVMAELLLRGAQTLGELRGRAARMEPIVGIDALRPIVDGLRSKGLLLLLTPPGRGCVVTHNLYQPQELDKVRSEHGQYQDAGASLDEEPNDSPAPTRSAATTTTERPAASAPISGSSTSAGAASTVGRDELQAMRRELTDVKRELAQQREDLTETIDQLRREVDDIKQQLGV